MPVSKDQSIVMQVAAKIASELTPKTDDVNTNITSFITAYDAVCEIILESQGLTASSSSASVTPTATTAPQVSEEELVMAGFPQATPQPSGGFSVRIKGKQHGPIPEWLNEQCAMKGVTEVWDNRDGIAQNPKRPWFKSTSSNDAFWAPRGK